MKFFICFNEHYDNRKIKAQFKKANFKFKYITDKERQILKSYPTDDSRSEFKTNNAIIVEISDLNKLNKVISNLTISGWGGVVGFKDAPLNCDAYIVVD